MNKEFLVINKTDKLNGTVKLFGAKNAALPILASLILAPGKSILSNLPFSDDIKQMLKLLRGFGAKITEFQSEKMVEVDTSNLNKYTVSPDDMKKMRASILVLGPLLSRLKKAEIGFPGGDLIGSRPIDMHLNAFAKMGATIKIHHDVINASINNIRSSKFILDYPSVGATENILMSVILAEGTSEIINAALEPEVLDLIEVLKKMGAEITINFPGKIVVNGVKRLNPIRHNIIFDRLEAGTFLLAAAISGGEVFLPEARSEFLEIFLEKLSQMGHEISVGPKGQGISLKGNSDSKPILIKTMPYPGFPTDLQAPMTAALCLASGTSVIEETVFENRLLHIEQLKKMGANISVQSNRIVIKGVKSIKAAHVTATDIRAAACLILAGFSANGATNMFGVNHLRRGYENIVEKLQNIGGSIFFKPY